MTTPAQHVTQAAGSAESGEVEPARDEIQQSMNNLRAGRLSPKCSTRPQEGQIDCKGHVLSMQQLYVSDTIAKGDSHSALAFVAVVI